MNEKQQKMMIAWLNDAHAMEMTLIENLEEKAKNAKDAGQSEVQTKIEEHLEETRRHMELIMGCIERLGGTVSKTKEMAGKAMGFLQGKMKSMSEDVMVKNSIESYVAEHLEIASYTSLLAAARELGDKETAEVCEEILEDEKMTAEWALTLIPESTTDFIASLDLKGKEA